MFQHETTSFLSQRATQHSFVLLEIGLRAKMMLIHLCILNLKNVDFNLSLKERLCYFEIVTLPVKSTLSAKC